MLSREEATGLLTEWDGRLVQAIEEGDGETMCESTRMVLFFVLTLRAYFPNEVDCETVSRLMERFQEAFDCVNQQLETGNPDGCYDLYEKNIGDRLAKLRNRWNEWFPVVSASPVA